MAYQLWRFIESLPNQFAFTGRNAANTANVNLFKINASDQLEFYLNPYLPSDPVANLQAATKQYVDNQDALKANIELDNLANTAVNATIKPANPNAEGEPELGSALRNFQRINVVNVNSSVAVSFTGDIQGDGVTVTNIPSTADLAPGMTVSGVDIDPLTMIASVDSPTQITLNSSALVFPTVASPIYAYNGLFGKTADATGSATDARGSGDAQWRSGNAGGAGNPANSGEARIRSGNAQAGNSGKIQLRTGTSVSGNSGLVEVLTGNSTSGNSGDINIAVGTAAGGTRGSVNITGNMIVLNALGSYIDANTHLISNVVDPVSAQDAATKNYVDSLGNNKANRELDNLQNTAVNADIIPGVDNSIKLGSAALRYSEVFAYKLNADNQPLVLSSTQYILFDSELAPNVDNAIDIGDGGARVRDIFAFRLVSGGSDDLIVEASGILYLKAQTNIEFNRNVLPDADISRELGSSSKRMLKVWSQEINAGASELDLIGAGIDANTNLIHNVVDPVAPQDAATKAYVDSVIASSAWNSETRTLTAGEIAAKQLTLVDTPLYPAQVAVTLYGGGRQKYSVDYTVSGAVVDWNALGLDGLLSAGDTLFIDYVA